MHASTFLVAIFITLQAFSQENTMVLVPDGTYKPFIKGDSKQISVASFFIDEKQVSNADFRKFVKENPQWSKENARKLFVDSDYLSQWESDSTVSKKSASGAPVVNVSWFAAKAYCEWTDRRLPTLDEWEYVAASLPYNSTDTNSIKKLIADWYSRNDTESNYKNAMGVWNMHGKVWEWVYDFDRIQSNSDSRNKEEVPAGFFCGSASLNASDASDYTSFVRYAFRSSLKGNYTVRNLGFRCAKSK